MSKDKDPSLVLRIPAEVRALLEETAEDRGVTVRAMVVRLVRDELLAYEDLDPGEYNQARTAVQEALRGGDDPVMTVLRLYRHRRFRSNLRLLVRLVMRHLDYDALVDHCAVHQGDTPADRVPVVDNRLMTDGVLGSCGCPGDCPGDAPSVEINQNRKG